MSELVITEVAPVVAYARSMSTFVADTSGELDAVLVELERRVTEIVAAEGAFHVQVASGCFVCR